MTKATGRRKVTKKAASSPVEGKSEEVQLSAEQQAILLGEDAAFQNAMAEQRIQYLQNRVAQLALDKQNLTEAYTKLQEKIKDKGIEL